MQEYREGVLLFRAEQEAVWNAVKVEDDALKAFWEERKGEYTWPDRVRFSEIFVTSDSLATVLRDSLNAGVDFAELAERHTQRSGYKKKQGDWGFQAFDANELATAAAKGAAVPTEIVPSPRPPMSWPWMFATRPTCSTATSAAPMGISPHHASANVARPFSVGSLAMWLRSPTRSSANCRAICSRSR